VHHWSEALTRSVYRQIAVDLPTNPMLLNSNVLVIHPPILLTQCHLLQPQINARQRCVVKNLCLAQA